jgi:RimJ/RimL family protein N-acetyltransferase
LDDVDIALDAHLTRVTTLPALCPAIDTDRLTLRAHGIEDFDDMCAMWTDAGVVRFIGGKVFSREEVWGRLLRYAGTWSLFGYGFWAVRERASGCFVGEVGFHNLHRDLVLPFEDRPELGYALLPRAHGQGFATEGASAALDWADGAWPGGETVCMIDPENTPSARVAARLGYREFARSSYKGEPVRLLSRRRGAVQQS